MYVVEKNKGTTAIKKTISPKPIELSTGLIILFDFIEVYTNNPNKTKAKKRTVKNNS